MSFANLGFVGSGSKQNNFRDPVFTGGTGHPSKKAQGMPRRRMDDVNMRNQLPQTEESSVQSTPPPSVHSDRVFPPPTQFPPQHVMRVTEESTLVQRCAYLEAQAKKNIGEIGDLHTKMERLSQLNQEMASSHYVTVSIVIDAPFIPVRNNETCEEAFQRCRQLRDTWSDLDILKKGTRTVLVYPMRDVHSSEIWMKSKAVDSESGQLEWRWVQIASKESGRRVAEFTL